MRQRIYIQLLILLIAVAGVTIVSCSSDEQELSDGGKAIVYGRIVTRADNGNTYVGADGDKEIINNWWVVFVKKDATTNGGKIEKIVVRDENKTTAVEQEGFRVDLAGGTYDVYTFANISKSTVEGLLTGEIKTIKEGQQMPDLSDVKFDINDTSIGGIANGTLVSKNGKAIPSSSKIERGFDPGSQSVDFEVIRMVAKFDFVFKNMSDKDITLRTLKLLPVQEGEVLLIPDETVADKEKETDPEILNGTNDKVYTKDLTFDFTDENVYANAIKLEANSWKNNTKWYKHSFYVRESSASSHPTKHFRIELSISGRDGKTSEALYTITDKVGGQPFTGFNRNDYIQIPIVFTDYKVELMADSYAPIGGYPTEVSENKPNEFYCTFSHQGEFIIMPYLYSAATGELVYYPDCGYEIVEKSAGVPDIEDPDKIFVDPTLGADVQGKLPTKNATTGEITGKLNTNEGTASVYIHIWVYPNPGDHTVKQDFYRRIYIIRKNP